MVRSRVTLHLLIEMYAIMFVVRHRKGCEQCSTEYTDENSQCARSFSTGKVDVDGPYLLGFQTNVPALSIYPNASPLWTSPNPFSKGLAPSNCSLITTLPLRSM